MRRGPSARTSSSTVSMSSRARAITCRSLTLPIALAPSPDLKVTSISIPEHGQIGQPVTLTYVVTNQGAGGTPPDQARWDDLIYLSRDRVLDLSSDRYLEASRAHWRPRRRWQLHRRSTTASADGSHGTVLRVRRHGPDASGPAARQRVRIRLRAEQRAVEHTADPHRAAATFRPRRHHGRSASPASKWAARRSA